jgi:TatA/E family protein of Tat protein translocase
MSAPGFWEIATLAVIAMLVFGPDKLPGMARTVGKTLGQFKREARSTMDELKRAADAVLAEVEPLRFGRNGGGYELDLALTDSGWVLDSHRVVQ